MKPRSDAHGEKVTLGAKSDPETTIQCRLHQLYQQYSSYDDKQFSRNDYSLQLTALHGAFNPGRA
jgi:hypothetical protein